MIILQSSSILTPLLLLLLASLCQSCASRTIQALPGPPLKRRSQDRATPLLVSSHHQHSSRSNCRGSSHLPDPLSALVLHCCTALHQYHTTTKDSAAAFHLLPPSSKAFFSSSFTFTKSSTSQFCPTTAFSAKLSLQQQQTCNPSTDILLVVWWCALLHFQHPFHPTSHLPLPTGLPPHHTKYGMATCPRVSPDSGSLSQGLPQWL